jgi:hypothetical protein
VPSPNPEKSVNPEATIAANAMMIIEPIDGSVMR